MRHPKGWGHRCHYCSIVMVSPKKVLRNAAIDASLPSNMRTIDHLIPLSRGGGNGTLNKVHACARCNVLKSDMTEMEFFIYIKTYGFATARDLKRAGISYEAVKAALRRSFRNLPRPSKDISLPSPSG